MGKTIAIFGTITTLLIVGGAYLLTSGSPTQESASGEVAAIQDENNQDYEYYWGDGCPHCEIVAEFFDTWEDYEAANITKYETWNNPSNSARLTKRANECGIPSNRAGVPLLYTPEGECIIGDTPIIDHFKSLNFDDKQTDENQE